MIVKGSKGSNPGTGRSVNFEAILEFRGLTALAAWLGFEAELNIMGVWGWDAKNCGRGWGEAQERTLMH